MECRRLPSVAGPSLRPVPPRRVGGGISIFSAMSSPDKGYRSAKTLKKLYHDQGLSLSEIGEKFDVSDQCILGWMRKLNIDRRSISQAQTTNRPEELCSEEWLRQKYWSESLTTPEIAEEINVSKTAVQDAMDREGVPRRPRSIPDGHPVNDPELIREKYWSDEMTINELANWLVVKPQTLIERMRNMGIPRRGQSLSATDGNVRSLHNEHWLWVNYIAKQKTPLEIARDLGVTRKPVRTWLKKHGFRLRGYRKSHTNGRLDLLDDGEWLRRAYCEVGLSTYGISEIIGIGRSKVSEALQEKGVEIRGPSSKSSDSDCFYGESWTRTRRVILERDDYSCRRCGLSNEAHKKQNGSGLHIHHIIPRINFESDEGLDEKKANHADNLVALCANCHKEVENNDANALPRLQYDLFEDR